MSDYILIHGVKYILSSRAAEITQYTKDYVGQLCRSGRVDAKRVGRIWFVGEESILLHKKRSIEQLTSNGNLASLSNFRKKTGFDHVHARLEYTTRVPVANDIRWKDMNGHVRESVRREPVSFVYSSDDRDLLPLVNKTAKNHTDGRIVTKSPFSPFSLYTRLVFVVIVFVLLFGFISAGCLALMNSNIGVVMAIDEVQNSLSIVIRNSPLFYDKGMDIDSLAANVLDHVGTRWVSFIAPK